MLQQYGVNPPAQGGNSPGSDSDDGSDGGKKRRSHKRSKRSKDSKKEKKEKKRNKVKLDSGEGNLVGGGDMMRGQACKREACSLPGFPLVFHGRERSPDADFQSVLQALTGQYGKYGIIRETDLHR